MIRINASIIIVLRYYLRLRRACPAAPLFDLLLEAEARPTLRKRADRKRTARTKWRKMRVLLLQTTTKPPPDIRDLSKLDLIT